MQYRRRKTTNAANTIGYSSVHAQLMSVPAYAVSALVCMSLAMLSDLTKNRGYILMAISPLVPIGFAILATVDKVGVRYFAIFLATSGAFTLSPILLAWGVGNSAGPAVLLHSSLFGWPWEHGSHHLYLDVPGQRCPEAYKWSLGQFWVRHPGLYYHTNSGLVPPEGEQEPTGWKGGLSPSEK